MLKNENRTYVHLRKEQEPIAIPKLEFYINRDKFFLKGFVLDHHKDTDISYGRFYFYEEDE